MTEVLSFCFSGVEIELLSVIQEKSLLADFKQNEKPALPELKSDELILLASLEHRTSLAELLIYQGLKINKHCQRADFFVVADSITLEQFLIIL